ncbi:hypothetical protein P7H00_01440 [Enterococcus pseudoavium]|uniref:Uncharacterized protein n=1 Tax=Enterococcus pseudoavium TaxID=44007 RepID=A0AAE4I107_9ENTE|nr:hypothetical protein [Enterococcus pseudoavium]MDT2735794.1 hypothetical protein [Enterococcus pseudoavium]MDT2754352.1 hypothetical protein [Enterococcus pseudoavium]MDT2769593.1 hypothetical protein [Enterococcus pseudoavium]
MNINDIWNSQENDVWNEALFQANKETGRDNSIETKMSKLNVEYIKNLEASEFYKFLHDEYFLWKYTAKNRLATTRKKLQEYESNVEELKKIQEELFDFNLEDAKIGLKRAVQIKGLGVAGGSGLLSLLYPSYFGTVDDMVVRALLTTDEYKDDETIKSINSQNIKIDEAVYLINIFKKKATELNKAFNQYCWTPRDIDVILWFFRDSK